LSPGDGIGIEDLEQAFRVLDHTRRIIGGVELQMTDRIIDGLEDGRV